MCRRLSMTILALLWFAAPSSAAPMCVAEAVAPLPVIDDLSTSAAPADLTVTCSELLGTPTTINVSYFFNVPVVQTGTPTLTTDLGTIYSGEFDATQMNVIRFLNVSVPTPTFAFTIDDILVDASLLPIGSFVVSLVSIAGSPLPINDPQQTVGVIGSTVPEPGTFTLLAIGLAAFGGARRRRHA